MKDALTVLGSALTVALFAGFAAAHPSNAAHLHPREAPLATGRGSFDALEKGHAQAADAEAILDQVTFPPENPLGWLPEIDELGNILLAVEVDAIVVHDGGTGGPEVVGMDIRGSRCSRSVYSVMARSPKGPWTVVCLPREFGLYEKLHPGAVIE